MELAAEVYTRVLHIDASHSSVPHLSNMQKTILDATQDCIKLLSIDGTLITMNRAGRIALNFSEDAEFGMPWLSLLSAELLEEGTSALKKAAAGQTGRFQGRTLGKDGLIYWDNLLTPLKNEEGIVIALLCVSRDVTEKVNLERALEAAVKRERLLASEMQHRIKNIFSVTAALSFIADKEATTDFSGRSGTEILRDKLYALARASDAIFAEQLPPHEGDAYVSLHDLITAILLPYGNKCTISGETLTISQELSTSLALFLHEHATNSVKYGAMGTAEGTVAVTWSHQNGSLSLDWKELGGPPLREPPKRRGFGSEMVDRIIKTSGGGVERHWLTTGLVSKLHIPFHRK